MLGLQPLGRNGRNVRPSSPAEIELNLFKPESWSTYEIFRRDLDPIVS
jgi:hypothetical protein